MIIDLHSRTPVYEQIKEQFIWLINNGVYAPGDKLPSIRTLAGELCVNVNTVKRAFQEMEADEIIISLPGRGMFVNDNGVNNGRVRQEALGELEKTMVSAKTRGVSEEEVKDLIKKIYGVSDI